MALATARGSYPGGDRAGDSLIVPKWPRCFMNPLKSYANICEIGHFSGNEKISIHHILKKIWDPKMTSVESPLTCFQVAYGVHGLEEETGQWPSNYQPAWHLQRHHGDTGEPWGSLQEDTEPLTLPCGPAWRTSLSGEEGGQRLFSPCLHLLSSLQDPCLCCLVPAPPKTILSRSQGASTAHGQGPPSSGAPKPRSLWHLETGTCGKQCLGQPPHFTFNMISSLPCLLSTVGRVMVALSRPPYLSDYLCFEFLAFFSPSLMGNISCQHFFCPLWGV